MIEKDLRRLVYKLDLKHSTKFTLLGIIQRVNWESWSGPVSVQDICNDMSLKSRTVSRGLAELAKLNIITRHATLRATPEGKQYHHRAINQINISVIIQMVDADTKALTPVTADSTPSVTADSTPSVTVDSTPSVTVDSTPSVKLADITTKDTTKEITTKDISTEENNNNTAEIESPTFMSDIPAEPKTLDDLNLSDAEAEVVAELKAGGHTDEFLIKAVLNNRRLSAKLDWRYQTEASSTRKETSYDPYKKF